MASSTDEDQNSNPTPNAEQQQQQQQQQQQSQQFTAVNNTPATTATLANGSAAPTAPMNGNTGGIAVAASGAPQPPIATSLFGGPTTLAAPTVGSVNGGRPSGSPEVQIPQTVGDDTWSTRAESQDLGGNGQKRKRTPEEMDRDNRAVSPTTQTQRHHLAAHEAALGGVSGAQDIRAQSIHIPPEEHYPVDEHRFHDEGPSFRAPHDGSPQPGEKRRKRVFSNRTKTGCITCRRRKKKCDEGKPECSNCKRGGFVCEGYSGKVSWQKPPGKSGSSVAGTPTLIQSKEHGDASASPTPIHQQRPMHTPQQPPHTPSMPYSVARTDDGAQPADTPGSPGSATALSHRFAAPALDTTTYATTPQTSTAPSAPSSVVATTNAAQQGQARRLSFSHQALTAAAGSPMRPRSEKDKMINSELYHASAPELVRERELCKSACWRYNNAASNPSLGVSPAEKGRLLLDILRPGKNWEIVNTGGGSAQSAASVTYVSEHGYTSDIVDVTVDAPFNCSYGYNIRLGKNVYIEFGCTILDSCEVTIKARTILSPNVSIYSATHPIDPRKRNGSRGPEMAKRVLIEEDCWLGGNVIVLGGITIGKGSVVGAGSVVTRDVPPFTVVAGNPARVIRGIYQNGIDM